MKTFTYTFPVTKEVIDHNGHVHNVSYLGWMIDAATRHSEFEDFGFEKCFLLGGTWVAKSHHIEYKKPAFEKDELRMETWIEEIGKIMSVRRYRITRTGDEAVVCEGKTEWVFVDAKKMRPMKIPSVIAEAFV